MLGLVFLSLLVVGVGYAGSFASGGPAAWAPWCLALGTCGTLMSLMALGAVRRGRIAPVLRWVFAGMFLWCGGCFAVALALPADEGPGGALTFDSSMLSEDARRRLREAQAAMARANGGESRGDSA